MHFHLPKPLRDVLAKMTARTYYDTKTRTWIVPRQVSTGNLVTTEEFQQAVETIKPTEQLSLLERISFIAFTAVLNLYTTVVKATDTISSHPATIGLFKHFATTYPVLSLLPRACTSSIQRLCVKGSWANTEDIFLCANIDPVLTTFIADVQWSWTVCRTRHTNIMFISA